MGKIIRNGIEFSSTVDTANNISYDNSLSGLEATTTQKAIDELSEDLGKDENGMTIHEKLDSIMDMKFARPASIKTWAISSGYGQNDAHGTLNLNTENCSTLIFGAVTESNTVTRRTLEIQANGSKVYDFVLSGTEQSFDVSNYDYVTIYMSISGSAQYTSTTINDISLE